MVEIYRPGNTEYSMNGDIVLMPEECAVEAELNGSWKMTLMHPKDEDGRWKYITDEAVISAPTFMGEKQLFRIFNKEKSDDGVEVNANPIFFDARKDCFLLDVRPTEKTGQEALNIMCAPNKKYTAISNIKKKSTSYFVRKNLIEAINGEDENSFVSRWGGEILFDNHKIIVNDKIGGDYGVKVIYGKNLTAVKEIVDTSEIITRIVPVAYNGYTLEGDTPWVDSPNINKYPTVYTKVIEFSDVKLSEDAQENEVSFETLKELRAELIRRCKKKYEEGCDTPKVTLEIDMEDLSKTEEYKEYAVLERVTLGDTVYCEHDVLEIVSTARVIFLKWDCIQNRIVSITLGEFQYNYLDKVSSTVNRVEKAIREDGSVIGEQVQGVINGVKAQMRAQSTIAKKQSVRAMLFEDLNPESPTFGAMCLGTMGFEIASRRTADGRDWDWSTFGTGAGFFADFIVAGTMLADRIKGGTLELGGKENGNGIAKVLDSSGKEIVRLDKDGVYAKGQYISDGVYYNRRVRIAEGTIEFSKADGTDKKMFIERSGDIIIVRIGGEIGDATQSKVLMRIFENQICLDSEDLWVNGGKGKTGRAEFSDGSYLEYKNGVMTGGRTASGSEF